MDVKVSTPPESAGMIPEPRRKIYRYTFYFAAIYNTLWGLGVILFPATLLGLVNIQTDPIGILFWQCIGMFVGVFAIGYYFCALDPERYWPFILIATLGKIFGPIGFIYGWLYLDVLPGNLGLTILTNDLLWWPVFFAYLADVASRSGKKVKEANLHGRN